MLRAQLAAAHAEIAQLKASQPAQTLLAGRDSQPPQRAVGDGSGRGDGMGGSTSGGGSEGGSGTAALQVYEPLKLLRDASLF